MGIYGWYFKMPFDHIGGEEASRLWWLSGRLTVDSKNRKKPIKNISVFCSSMFECISCRLLDSLHLKDMLIIPHWSLNCRCPLLLNKMGQLQKTDCSTGVMKCQRTIMQIKRLNHLTHWFSCQTFTTGICFAQEKCITLHKYNAQWPVFLTDSWVLKMLYITPTVQGFIVNFQWRDFSVKSI